MTETPADRQQQRKTSAPSQPSEDHRIRELERQVGNIPYQLELQGEKIKSDLREHKAEITGQLNLILEKIGSLATREYVYNRAWALLAILVALIAVTVLLINFARGDGRPQPPIADSNSGLSLGQLSPPGPQLS